jgi:hypothetical protein
MRLCLFCGGSFSETKNTFLEGLRTPVSLIWQVLKARTEGMALKMQLAGFLTLLKRAFLPGKKNFWFAADVVYVFNVTRIHPVSC